MQDTHWLQREAQITLARLLPRIEGEFTSATQYQTFVRRMQQHFPRAFKHLLNVYGGTYDFFFHLENIVATAAQMYAQRPDDLRALDAEREADPLWFKRETMIGAVAYVDLFAGDLAGVSAKIPYLQELGITYLHLMPLFRAPSENSDGGYAVSDYRKVNPTLGTIADLADLAKELRAAGISLVLDFVFNHTSDEHEWALRAQAGEARYQRFYYIFPDRALPDQYEQNLREIFPEQDPGNFTYRSDLKQWVWTTFNHFQWDLNYSNPDVFNAMLAEMLFLANQGTEILRLDAVAFIWKRMGTPCENLPEVHDLIRAFNAFVQITAPATIFKSEAIVHPDDVASYIDWDECPLSYNPTFMALIWEALATREVKLLRHSMSKRWDIDSRAAWVNYVRVHDDIGWSFANEDAAELGITGFDHRLFLNKFYTGEFPGSFATGLPFNFNPQTLDMRICGTSASLAGLEKALALNNDAYIEDALRRIVMIHALIIGAGGIPLIYLGDELATCNNYDFRKVPGKAGDNRWVHRPPFPEDRAAQRHDTTTAPGFVFSSLAQIIHARQRNPILRDEYTIFFNTNNAHVLGLVRNREVLLLANFSEQAQMLNVDWLAVYWHLPAHIVDLISSQTITVSTGRALTLEPYQCLWLADATRAILA